MEDFRPTVQSCSDLFLKVKCFKLTRKVSNDLTLYPEQLVIQILSDDTLNRLITVCAYILLVLILRVITEKGFKKTMGKFVEYKIFGQEFVSKKPELNSIEKIYQKIKTITIIAMAFIFYGVYFFRPSFVEVVLVILKIIFLILFILNILWYTWRFTRAKKRYDLFKDKKEFSPTQRKIFDVLIKQMWLSFFLPYIAFIPVILLLFEIRITF